MQQDKLTDIEELAYHRKYYKKRKTVTVIYYVLFFVLGFTVAKIYYKGITFENADNLSHPEMKQTK